MLSTSKKILIARFLSFYICGARTIFRKGTCIRVSRRGIIWKLDLNEGIDLAIFLLGGFEIRTLQLYKKIITEGDVVLDVGANIGAHTLPFAELVGKSGYVFSFEPTAFAYNKQLNNISLNPLLEKRISAF